MNSFKKYLLFILVYILFFLTSYYRLDTDFGWHLQAGNYIRVHGIPSHDIFTYTASVFAWINHEWLNDVIVSFIYQWGGFFLLAVFFGLLWTLSLFIASRKFTPFIVLLSAFSLLPYSGVRPIVWSIFFLAIVERVCDKKRTLYFLILPPLFLIWANLHGGFILGLLLVVYYSFNKKVSVPLLVLSIASTFINPYGMNIYKEIARTLLDSSLRVQISEWSPFTFGAFAIFYISLFCALLLLFHGKKNYSFPKSPGILLFFSFLSTRNTPFFIASSERYFEQYIDGLYQLIPKKLSGVKLRFWEFLKLTATIVILYGVIHAPFLLPKNREDEFPKYSVAYLKNNPCNGNIFNSYEYGGYLIWQLPKQQVYIDGRMPSWQLGNEKYLNRYYKIFSDKDFRKKEFEKYSIGCVLIIRKERNSFQKFRVPDEGDLAQRLYQEGWKTAVKEENSMLLIAPESQKSP